MRPTRSPGGLPPTRRTPIIRCVQNIDAFLSYAHEDEASAIWLAELLGKFWVPRRRRRNIFRDATHLTAEGGLTQNIQRALEASRWLIVLSSRHSAASTWVDHEITHFLARPRSGDFDACKRILLCRVGEPADEVMPARASGLFASDDDPLIPDLRGPMPATDMARRRRNELEALSLLAPLVGAVSKEDLVQRRGRAYVLIAASTALLGLVVGGYVGARAYWEGTEAWRREHALRAAVASAQEVRADDPSLFRLFVALGREERDDDVRSAVTMYDSDEFRRVARAVAAAAAPVPDCQAAQVQLAPVQRAWARQVPTASVYVAARCTELQASLLRDLEPGPPDKDALESLAINLARVGLEGPARALVERADLPATRRWLIDGWIAAGSDPAVASSRMPRPQCDDAMLFRDALDVVEEADRRQRLGATSMAVYLDFIAECIDGVDVNSAYLWTWVQEGSAILAGAGRRSDARNALEQMPRRTAMITRTPDWADAWAWRALAWQRVGEGDMAREARKQAFQLLSSTLAPSTRTWSEVPGIVESLALGGDWYLAFDVIAQVPDARARLLARVRLIDMWSLRSPPSPSPRTARLLTTFLLL